jgi:hypothetical protein
MRNGIQEIARSILVSSTTERTLFPPVIELNDLSLIFTPITFFQRNSIGFVTPQ